VGNVTNQSNDLDLPMMDEHNNNIKSLAIKVSALGKELKVRNVVHFTSHCTSW